MMTEPYVARVAANVFCLGETVAVPLFKELRAACTVAPAKRALDRILRDEVRHRDFGWTLLSWLFESPLASQLRRTVESELPDYFDRLRRSYAPASASAISIAPADASWGLMPPAKYADCLRRTLERDWVPRFAKIGIDAKAAWRSQDSTIASNRSKTGSAKRGENFRSMATD